MQQNTLMMWDPATGESKPYPSQAAQWRKFHGQAAWLFNPWADDVARRDARDVGSDPFGLLIQPANEPVFVALEATAPLSPAKVSRFRKTAQGTVLDDEFGLEWGESSERKRPWSEAKDKIASMGDGWRLPTVLELRSLVDYERREPAIDIEYFPDTKSDWYWSSSPVVGWPEGAWYVLFNDGDVGSFGRDGSGFVRPVRAARARQ